MELGRVTAPVHPVINLEVLATLAERRLISHGDTPMTDHAIA